MGLWFSMFLVLVLVLLVSVGVGVIGLNSFFGVVIPYVALFIFLVGIIYMIVKWGKIPVPFKIPTTCGQGKSHPWIKANNFENPSNTMGVIVRMALEVLFFRSLFRNTRAELREGQKVVYGGSKWLWVAGLAFHWSFLIIVVRHLRLLTEPVPFFVGFMEGLDGLLEISLPTLYLTDMVLLIAVTYLFFRRVIIPQIRYISLPADYFPLILIFGVAISGVLMRHIYKVDILKVKELATGLLSFHPVAPAGIGVAFYIHLFLVSILLMYFPFSKLMHMGGVFLSPTRNMPGDNRRNRHVNPWNYPVKVHTYEEYEDEFREKMKAAGLPVEKE